MTADLVTRLRHWSREDDADIGHEAADEIERANLARLHAVHERDCAVEDLHAVHTVLASALGCTGYGPEHARWIAQALELVSPRKQDDVEGN
jgi:hypothetical protein